jgi:hypothetical protein
LQGQGVAVPRRGQRHATGARGPNGSIARGTRYGLAKRRELEEQNAQLIAALYSAGPSELDAYRQSGVTGPATALAADVAAATILRLRRAVEGEPAPGADHPSRPLSPQRDARLGHAQRLLTLGIALELRALSADDREAASSAGTLIRAADSIITDTLGMDLEHDVPSLHDYLAQQHSQTPAIDAQRANGADHAALPVEAENAAQEGEASAAVCSLNGPANANARTASTRAATGRASVACDTRSRLPRPASSSSSLYPRAAAAR